MRISVIVFTAAIFFGALIQTNGCMRGSLYTNAKDKDGSFTALNLLESVRLGYVSYAAPWISGGTTYLSCNALTLSLQDLSYAPMQYSGDITANLQCGGHCVFYSNSACTSVMTQALIPAGSGSSATFYVIPAAPLIQLDTVESPGLFTGIITPPITVRAPYSAIDSNYVWALADLSTAGSAVNGSTVAVNDAWIFQTQEGYRGKLLVKALTTTTLPGDTINFDMVLWDATGAVINSANSVNIVACTTGNCFFDFHQSPPVVTGSPNADFQWAISGSSFALIPNANSVIRLIQ